MTKLSKKRFHLVFSFVVGTLMIRFMTCVITLVNVGTPPDFFPRWGKALLVAYAVGVPVIYFVAPLARRLTARWVEMP